MAGALGLKGVRLICGDAANPPEDLGQFDYIIAHGIYSWVPEPVRKGILEVCRKLLNEHGIGFISYNAYPGGRMREMVRDMLLFHTRAISNPQEKIGQALALARFLAESVAVTDPYQKWLSYEMELLLKQDDAQLYHDELSDCHQRFYFVQFIQQAAAHGLQFVGEADFFESFAHCLTEEGQATLDKLAGNRILREQYLDFAKCRRFRQTLLCHEERTIGPSLDVSQIERLLISSQAKRVEENLNLRPGVIVSYRGPKEAGCSTDLPIAKAALAQLARLYPQPTAFGELFDKSASMLPEAEAKDRVKLMEFLAQLYTAGVVEFFTVKPPLAQGVSARPAAFPLARWQAQRGNTVTTVFHRTVEIEDEVGRDLLLWLDGNTDQAQLVDNLIVLLKKHNSLPPARDDEHLRRVIADRLAENLNSLLRVGLLTA